MQWLSVFLHRLRTTVNPNPLNGEGFQINLGTYCQKYLESQM